MKLMATATLAATLNIPIFDLRPATMDRILIIEGDGALRTILRRLFSSEGYEVDVVRDGVAGLKMLLQKPPVAVILGMQRPESSKCDLCRKIAHLIPGLPLVILGTSSGVRGKVVPLRTAADHHLTVPVSPRELVAHLRALIRNTSRAGPGNLYAFGDVMVDFFKVEITRSGKKITVTAKEFKTLEFLTKNAERVISRNEMLNEVWGYHNYPRTRTVDNHILRLRQKLESDPSHPSHILTVHGLGYKFLP
jgi:DNA-binding response OmpR family regulator